MYITIPKNIEGNYLWNCATNPINVARRKTSVYVKCASCGTKKSKRSFVDVKE